MASVGSSNGRESENADREEQTENPPTDARLTEEKRERLLCLLAEANVEGAAATPPVKRLASESVSPTGLLTVLVPGRVLLHGQKIMQINNHVHRPSFKCR